MILNYLKSALRQMKKHKGFSIINLAGLTIGIAVCFLLLLYIQDELSYDRFHQNADRIYRFQWEAKYGDNSWKIPQVPMPLTDLVKNDFPDVEAITQFFPGGFTLKKGEDLVREQNGLFVDEQFFEVFDITTIAGVSKTAMENPNALLLTEGMAEKYFGVKDNYQSVIGKTLETSDGNLLEVVGVVKGFPLQSHLQFDYIGAIKRITFLENRKTQWGSASVYTYFLLNENAEIAALDAKVQTFVDENLSSEERMKGGNFTRFPTEAITSIHLSARMQYIWIFSLIASFILILACINFINLTTARALTRAKEVGVRKILGSTRRQLIQQFFSESTLFVLGAMVLGLFLTRFSLPYFNELSNKELSLALFQSPTMLLLLVGLILITAMLTGAIPAYFLSSFIPAKVIKGSLTQVRGKDRLRQGLVVFQFCISSVLIIGTFVIQDQLKFLQNKDLGFNKEEVMVIQRATALRQNYDPFLEQLQQLPFVKQVSTSLYLPGDSFDSTLFEPEQPSNYENTSLTYNHVGSSFLDALELEMTEGRFFNPDLSTDSSSFVINEKAAEKLGWDNPIGKKLTYGGQLTGPVIGVVKDFNFSSLHEEIKPIVLLLRSFNLSQIVIRLEKGTTRDQIQAIQKEWKTMAAGAPFQFTFLDEQIQRLYDAEERVSLSFTVFSILAIFIACLGLLGLASFTAEKRSKEIGIRKVLGASVANIINLLSKEFLKLVLIALVIASPIAWYGLNQWLENFAYHINIQWWVFMLTGSLAIIIAFLTVSFQSLKVALANPIKALRNE